MFQVLILNTNNSIQHNSFIYTQFKGSKYLHIIPIIQFLHTDKEFQVLVRMSNNSIKQ